MSGRSDHEEYHESYHEVPSSPVRNISRSLLQDRGSADAYNNSYSYFSYPHHDTLGEMETDAEIDVGQESFLGGKSVVVEPNPSSSIIVSLDQSVPSLQVGQVVRGMYLVDQAVSEALFDNCEDYQNLQNCKVYRNYLQRIFNYLQGQPLWRPY